MVGLERRNVKPLVLRHFAFLAVAATCPLFATTMDAHGVSQGWAAVLVPATYKLGPGNTNIRITWGRLDSALVRTNLLDLTGHGNKLISLYLN